MHPDSSAAGQAELWALCRRIFAEQRAARQRHDWTEVTVCSAELATLVPQVETVARRLGLRRRA